MDPEDTIHFTVKHDLKTVLDSAGQKQIAKKKNPQSVFGATLSNNIDISFLAPFRPLPPPPPTHTHKDPHPHPHI